MSARPVVFVACADSDVAFARAFARQLERTSRLPFARSRIVTEVLPEALPAGPKALARVDDAVAHAEWLVVVASPDAAKDSVLRALLAKAAAADDSVRLLIVLRAGTLLWSKSAASFDWSVSDAFPPTLQRPGGRPLSSDLLFSGEPNWVDLRDWENGGGPRGSRAETFDVFHRIAATILGDDLDAMRKRHVGRVVKVAVAMVSIAATSILLSAWRAHQEAVDAKKSLDLREVAAIERRDAEIVRETEQRRLDVAAADATRARTALDRELDVVRGLRAKLESTLEETRRVELEKMLQRCQALADAQRFRDARSEFQETRTRFVAENGTCLPVDLNYWNFVRDEPVDLSAANFGHDMLDDALVSQDGRHAVVKLDGVDRVVDLLRIAFDERADAATLRSGAERSPGVPSEDHPYSLEQRSIGLLRSVPGFERARHAIPGWMDELDSRLSVPIASWSVHDGILFVKATKTIDSGIAIDLADGRVLGDVYIDGAYDLASRPDRLVVAGAFTIKCHGRARRAWRDFALERRNAESATPSCSGSWLLLADGAALDVATGATLPGALRNLIGSPAPRAIGAGRIVVGVDAARALTIVDCASGERRRVLDETQVEAFDVTEDAASCVVADLRGGVTRVPLDGHGSPATIHGPVGRVRMLRCAAEEIIELVEGPTGTASLWVVGADPTHRTELAPSIRTAVVSPQGARVFVVPDDRATSPFVLDVAGRRVIGNLRELASADDPVAAFSRDGRYLFVADANARLRAWDVGTGEPVWESSRRLGGRPSWISVVGDDDGLAVACVSDDGVTARVHVIDFKTAKLDPVYLQRLPPFWMHDPRSPPDADALAELARWQAHQLAFALALETAKVADEAGASHARIVFGLDALSRGDTVAASGAFRSALDDGRSTARFDDAEYLRISLAILEGKL